MNESEIESLKDQIMKMEKILEESQDRIKTLEEEISEKCDHINEEKTKSQTQFDKNQEILD